MWSAFFSCLKEYNMRQTIDTLVNAYLTAGGPGAVVGISRGGESLYRQGYGQASLEWNTPIETDTVFRVASSSRNNRTVSPNTPGI